MKVVLDTNVLVSGFLNPYNPPGSLVLYAAEGRLQLCYDARILAEYREVLRRPKFNLKLSAIDDFLVQVEAEGISVVGKPLPHRLPDATDEAFVEVALAAEARYLVTGNTKHFPQSACRGVTIATPRSLLETLRKMGD